MEIGKVPQAPGQAAETSQAGNLSTLQETGGASNSSQLAQKDFQVHLDESIKNKLADLANLLQNREQLLQSLPEDVRNIVRQLLQQISSPEDVAQGMDYLLKSQKNIAEQLHNLGNVLEVVVTLQQEKYSEVQTFLNKVAEFLKAQGELLPDQLANQLLLLAKEGTAWAQGNLKQAAEQFLQQLSSGNLLRSDGESQEDTVLMLGKQLTQNSGLSQEDVKRIANALVRQVLPEDMDRLTAKDKTAILQFAKLLEMDMPMTLQQAEKSGIPNVIEKWSVLKAADVQQFANIAPKVLEQAADTLKQLYQELTAAPDKSSLTSKLESFAQNLPPLLGKAVGELIKQGMPEQSTSQFINTCKAAAVINKDMPEDLKAVMANLTERITVKTFAAPTADLLAQIAKHLSGAASSVEQLKVLMKQITQQFSFVQGKLSETIQAGAEQFAKAVEQNIPQALQDMAVKNKLPELSKMWLLLKTAGAEQWQKTDPENLQRSAATVKELAHSLYKSIAGDTERQTDHKILSFSMPFYFTDGTSYPTHIHIYHQEKENSNPMAKRQFETWMRVSVDTQNIGVVDSVFRLYEENKLDLRVIFPDTEAIQEFKQTLPEIRKSIEDTKLTLTNIMINKI